MYSSDRSPVGEYCDGELTSNERKCRPTESRVRATDSENELSALVERRLCNFDATIVFRPTCEEIRIGYRGTPARRGRPTITC
jgi:hypothetical protein